MFLLVIKYDDIPILWKLGRKGKGKNKGECIRAKRKGEERRMKGAGHRCGMVLRNEKEEQETREEKGRGKRTGTPWAGQVRSGWYSKKWNVINRCPNTFPLASF